MGVHRCISTATPVEWNQALQGIPHAFAHTWESCYAMQLTSGLKTYLYCFETENVRIVCPIAERNFEQHTDIVTPFGFSGFAGIGDCAEFPDHWKQFVRQRGYVCGYIGLHPVFENRTYCGPNDILRYNTLYILDLTRSYDELFANLSRNRKRQLKHWDKMLDRMVLEKSELIDFFLTNYREFVRRKNASTVYYFTRETLSFLLSLDNVVIVGARNSECIEAALLFAYTAAAGECLFYVSLPESRNHSVELHWYAATYLKTLQVPLLNLGGGVQGDDGVAKFKQRFGAKQFPLGCLKQIYEPAVFTSLCRRTGTDPDKRDGYFPPYRSA